MYFPYVLLSLVLDSSDNTDFASAMTRCSENIGLLSVRVTKKNKFFLEAQI